MTDFTIITLNDGRSQARFEINYTDPDGREWKYNDALVMQPAQWDALDATVRDAMAQQRFDNWYAVVTAPPPPEEPAPPSDGG